MSLELGLVGAGNWTPSCRIPVSTLDHSYLFNTEGSLFNFHRSQKWLVCAHLPAPARFLLCFSAGSQVAQAGCGLLFFLPLPSTSCFCGS